MNMNTLMALLQHTARATVLKELKKKKTKKTVNNETKSFQRMNATRISYNNHYERNNLITLANFNNNFAFDMEHT